MIVYIPFTPISSWILDRKGLRFGVLVGVGINTVGAALRCLATSADTFYWALIGQTLGALAQTFILGVPPKVAANWFGEHERTTATSIGALFNQVST
jgi:MFS family permease